MISDWFARTAVTSNEVMPTHLGLQGNLRAKFPETFCKRKAPNVFTTMFPSEPKLLMSTELFTSRVCNPKPR